LAGKKRPVAKKLKGVGNKKKKKKRGKNNADYGLQLPADIFDE
jgi:hypothetical protein